MEYRPLGRTGVQVTTLALGSMNFGQATSADEATDVIHRAIDAGVNLIDTANVYGQGESEQIVGEALRQSANRDRIILATKFWGVMDPTDPNEQGASRRHLIAQCDASLRRLQTDWIDLYQVHRPSADVAIDETLRALDDLIRAGKVRFIGTSTFAAWQVVDSLWASKELGLNRVVSEQPPYHLLDRRIERELIPMAQSYGLAVLPWSPLAQGFLTGKYRRGDAPPEGSRFEDPEFGEMWENFGFTEANPGVFPDAAYDVLDVVESIAAERGCSTSQVALAWCGAQAGITSVIIGPRTPDQLSDNLAAVELELTEGDFERLDAVAPPGQAILPYYLPELRPNAYHW